VKRIHSKPQLIDWELFKQVRHGDILITKWTEHNDGRYRLVITGPADELNPNSRRNDGDLTVPTSKLYITVPIHHRSWTNRAHTCMNLYDLTTGTYGPSYIMRAKRGARWLCQIEQDYLERSQFDVARELERELHEASLGKYTGQCKRWLRAFAQRARKAKEKR